MKKISIVQYNIFVNSENEDDLKHTINEVLNNSDVLNYVVNSQRWA